VAPVREAKGLFLLMDWIADMASRICLLVFHLGFAAGRLAGRLEGWKAGRLEKIG